MKRRNFLASIAALAAAPALAALPKPKRKLALTHPGEYGTSIAEQMEPHQREANRLMKARLDKMYLEANPPIIVKGTEFWVNLDLKPGKIIQWSQAGDPHSWPEMLRVGPKNREAIRSVAQWPAPPVRRLHSNAARTRRR
jgi:hypothetical protein